jgi:hypothetical protein
VPTNTREYPSNWKQLREQAMARARGACECTGHCGLAHDGYAPAALRCHAPHDRRIIRDPDEKARWWFVEDAPSQLTRDGCKVITVILTTAHLCQDHTCGDLEHLRMMCQLCHLRLDRYQHSRNASATRRKQKEAAGQLTFIKEP